MKKKIFGFVLLGVFTILALSTVTSCKNYDDDIDELKATDATLAAAIASVTVDVDAELASLQSQLNAAKADLESKIEAAKAAATDEAKALILEEINKVVAQISALDARVATLEEASKQFDEILEQLQDLKNADAYLADQILGAIAHTDAVNDALTAKIKELIEADKGLEAAITANQVLIAQLNEKLYGEGGDIVKIFAELGLQNQALENYKIYMAAIIEGLGDDIASLKIRMGNAETTLIDLQGKIDALAALLDAKIAEVMAEIAALDTKTAGADAALGNRIDALKADLDAAVTALNALIDKKVDKTEYQAAVDAINAKIAELADVMFSNDLYLLGEITTLQEALEALEIKHSQDVQDILEKLSKETADRLAADAVLQKNIDDAKAELKGKISELDEKYAALVKALEAADENLQHQIDENKADINALKEAIRDLQARVEQNEKDIAAIKSDIQAFKDEYAQKIGEIEAALNTLNKYLEDLITGLLVQQVEGHVYCGQPLGKTIRFPYDSAPGVVAYGSGQVLYNTDMKIYATVNPSGKNFVGTTLKLIDSQNMSNGLVNLSPLAKSEKVIKRDVKNAEGPVNGFYEMDVTANMVLTGTDYKRYTDDSEMGLHNILYALATDYDGVNGSQRVTSKYEINTNLIQITENPRWDWTGYYEEAARTPWTRKDGEGSIYYEFKYANAETTYAAYMKTNLHSADVHSFYVEYDAKAFAEAPGMKVYSGRDVNKPLKFVCKEEALDTKQLITIYVLHYNGKTDKIEKKVRFHKTVFAPATLTPQVVPGAGYKDETFTSFNFKEIMTYALGEENLAQFFKIASSGSEDIYISSISTNVFGDKDELAKNLADFIDSKGAKAYIIEYDPKTVDLNNPDNNKFVVTFRDKNHSDVFEITVGLNVLKPTHLDGYIGANKKEAAFDVFGTGHPNRTICWSADVHGNPSYNLTGSFAFSGMYGQVVLVPDAPTVGHFGWSKSNNSIYQFECQSNIGESGIHIYNYPYNITVDPKNVSVFGYDKTDENKTMYVDNKTNYLDSTKAVKVAQSINYYALDMEGSTKYTSDQKYNFELGFYDAVNYGMYKQAEEGVINLDVVIPNELPATGIRVEFRGNEFKYDDYSVSPVDKDAITLLDSRIKNVEVELVHDPANNWSFMEDFNFRKSRTNNYYIAEFNYRSEALVKPIVVNALLKVTDQFGVINVMKFNFILQGPHGAKAE